jgi:hypothetical protein
MAGIRREFKMHARTRLHAAPTAWLFIQRRLAALLDIIESCLPLRHPRYNAKHLVMSMNFEGYTLEPPF